MVEFGKIGAQVLYQASNAGAEAGPIQAIGSMQADAKDGMSMKQKTVFSGGLGCA